MNAFHVPAMFVARTAAPVDARFLPLALVDRTAPDAAQRLVEANRWTDTAAPLLAAYLAIYDAHDRAYSTDHQASRDVLLRMYAGNLSDLHDEIEAVRDEALSDASVTAHHVHDTPEAIEIADATNDWLSDEVTSVAAAIDAAFRARRAAEEAEANASTRSAWGMA